MASFEIQIEIICVGPGFQLIGLVNQKANMSVQLLNDYDDAEDERFKKLQLSPLHSLNLTKIKTTSSGIKDELDLLDEPAQTLFDLIFEYDQNPCEIILEKIKQYFEQYPGLKDYRFPISDATFLHIALFDLPYHQKVVDALIEKKVAFDHPIFRHAYKGNEEKIFSALQNNKRFLNSYDHLGYYSVHYAAVMGHERIVEEILKIFPEQFNNQKNYTQRTVAHFVLMNKHFHLANRLLNQENKNKSYRIDFYLKDYLDGTLYTVMKGYSEKELTLLHPFYHKKLKAWSNNPHNESIRAMVFELALNGRFRQIRQLNESDLPEYDSEGYTLFHWMVSLDNAEDIYEHIKWWLSIFPHHLNDQSNIEEIRPIELALKRCIQTQDPNIVNFMMQLDPMPNLNLQNECGYSIQDIIEIITKIDPILYQKLDARLTHEKMVSLSKEYGCVVEKVLGDGNCAYTAVIKQIIYQHKISPFQRYNANLNHIISMLDLDKNFLISENQVAQAAATLRTMVYIHAKLHWDDLYKNTISNIEVERIKLNAEWADQHELTMISRFLQLNIAVIDDDPKSLELSIIKQKNIFRTLCLGRTKRNHFDSLQKDYSFNDKKNLNNHIMQTQDDAFSFNLDIDDNLLEKISDIKEPEFTYDEIVFIVKEPNVFALKLKIYEHLKEKFLYHENTRQSFIDNNVVKTDAEKKALCALYKNVLSIDFFIKPRNCKPSDDFRIPENPITKKKLNNFSKPMLRGVKRNLSEAFGQISNEAKTKIAKTAPSIFMQSLLDKDKQKESTTPFWSLPPATNNQLTAEQKKMIDSFVWPMESASSEQLMENTIKESNKK